MTRFGSASCASAHTVYWQFAGKSEVSHFDEKASVKLTNFRLEHGVATRLDVLQAQQTLDIAYAQIPDLERQIAQEEDAISILPGNYPQAVTRGRPLVDQALPPEVPPGLPSSLLKAPARYSRG